MRWRQVQFEWGKNNQVKGAAYLAALGDSAFISLREYLDAVDRICRDVWHSQGQTINAGFVRGTVRDAVNNAIEACAAGIKGEVDLLVMRKVARDATPALRHLARSIRQLKGEVTVRYEIEARELEYGARGLNERRETLSSPGNESAKELPSDRTPRGVASLLNFVLPSGVSHAEVVQEIAKQLHWRLDDPLPESLKELSLLRGRTVFGNAERVLDGIAETHDLRWVAKDGVLRFTARPLNENKQQGLAAMPDPKESPELSGRTAEVESTDHRFMPHVPRSNPISATCKDGRVTVLVSSFVMDLPDGSLNINSGSIGGLSKGTLYHIFFDAPGFNRRELMVPTYNVSTSKIFAGIKGRFFVGSVLTPTKDGEASIGLGDGGVGAFGSAIDTRPKSRAEELTDHERRICVVIQRGSKGRQYCRELDSAGVAPLRTGVWKDCPRKYESAYLEGEPWRHRIQDEKSKVRRKAKLAGLAKLASE